MYQIEKEQIDKTLEVLIKKNRFSSFSKIYIFGAGDYSREIVNYLKINKIHIDGILDNDIRKQNTFFEGIKVIDPKEVKCSSSLAFIICSQFWKEMRKQLLRNRHHRRSIIIIKLITYRDKLHINILGTFKGKKIYREIRSCYPNSSVLLCPYTGTGDIYLISSYLEQYLQKEGITDYCLVVVSTACNKVAKLFSINNIYQIDGSEACWNLIKYYMICPEECDIKVLNDGWGDIYVNPAQWIRGLHGMNFSNMFKKFVFDLDESAEPKHPDFIDQGKRVNEFGVKYELKKGRTIVIAPYSTTLRGLSDVFWERLVIELKQKDYAVCTNCDGRYEKPISGARPVLMPLDMAPQFISWCGGFVGVRSGLCDVVSGADAKKVVLYNKSDYFFRCTAFEYFSLNKIGLGADILEIEYGEEDIEQAIQKIISVF